MVLAYAGRGGEPGAEQLAQFIAQGLGKGRVFTGSRKAHRAISVFLCAVCGRRYLWGVMAYLRQPLVHTRSADFRWSHLFAR